VVAKAMYLPLNKVSICRSTFHIAFLAKLCNVFLPCSSFLVDVELFVMANVIIIIIIIIWKYMLEVLP
jgi:hypothetical protein